jgi:hypothetical protein
MEISQLVKTTNVKNLTGKSQGSSGYMNVVTILIESYALESIWILMGGIIWGQVVSFWFIESEHYIVVSPP